MVDRRSRRLILASLAFLVISLVPDRPAFAALCAGGCSQGPCPNPMDSWHLLCRTYCLEDWAICSEVLGGCEEPLVYFKCVSDPPH